MNHFFFSNQPGRPEAQPNTRRMVPGVLVIRKADGREIQISQSKFHEALHEVAIAPEDARRMLVTTPTGTSTVEISHEILERMPLEAIRELEISRYVPGGNVMDKRLLIRGILEILGHTAAAQETYSVAEKEALLLAKYEQEQAAKVAAADALKHAAAEDAAAKALSDRAKPEPRKAPKKAAPKKDEAKEA